MKANNRFVNIQQENGAGRPTVVIYERGEGYENFIEAIVNAGIGGAKTVVLVCELVNDSNWREAANELLSLLDSGTIRHASFVGFGAAASLLQEIALRNTKLVRSLVVVDASTRPHASILSRAVDRLEEVLPLGLPLRSKSNAFDGKPFLQRIRCPALVVSTKRASSYKLEQGHILATELPTAWRIALKEADEARELIAILEDFKDVKAKCPQRVR